MTKEEYYASEKCVGKLLYIDSSTNQLWTEELISAESKKGKALLARFPKGTSFKKEFTIKFILKGATDDFNLGLE